MLIALPIVVVLFTALSIEQYEHVEQLVMNIATTHTIKPAQPNIRPSVGITPFGLPARALSELTLSARSSEPTQSIRAIMQSISENTGLIPP